jgi:hypothetical protein
MRMEAVNGTLLGLTIMFLAGMPMHAQEPKSLEPPKAALTAPKEGGETPGKPEQETLYELWGRREKAYREQQLLEAQLAVKKAEAQRADAEVQIFRLQHPDVFNAAIEKATESDRVVERLRSEIVSAMADVDRLRLRVRNPTDPSIMIPLRRLRQLEAELNERTRIHSLKRTAFQTSSLRSAGDPTSTGSPSEIERKLDQLIGELQGLRRDLLKNPRNP